MHLSKEIKIGLLVAATLVIFFPGFYFLKGANVFSNDREYYCYYPNVEGLQNSANVQIDGLNVGHVARISLAGSHGVKVIIAIDKTIPIPVGSVANLASFDLLGTKLIKLELGKGPGILKKGEQLQTAVEGGVMDNVSAELTPRLRELKSTIIALDTALAGINDVVGDENQKELSAAIRNINATSQNLVTLTSAISKESGTITSIIHNANSVTGNLAKENDTVKQILSNVNSATRQLANAPIQKTLADLQKTSSELQAIINKINTNQGSLGMLINDKDVYNNLNNSLHSMSSLMEDIQAHPKKYINVTVFGKKGN